LRREVDDLLATVEMTVKPVPDEQLWFNRFRQLTRLVLAKSRSVLRRKAPGLDGQRYALDPRRREGCGFEWRWFLPRRLSGGNARNGIHYECGDCEDPWPSD
jgi:hypothetical protein